MFFCFGENGSPDGQLGIGKTVEDAILAWSECGNINNAIDLYQSFKPTIVEGEERSLTIKMVKTYTVEVK